MKLRRIAAALVIVSLGAASFTFAAVRGQMADCRITEKTIVGDAAAAAGLSASFGMGLQNQLYDTTVQDIRCDIKRNLKFIFIAYLLNIHITLCMLQFILNRYNRMSFRKTDTEKSCKLRNHEYGLIIPFSFDHPCNRI